MGDIRFDGLDSIDDLADALTSKAERVEAQAADVVRRSAADLQARAKRNAPVDTGRLRASITTSRLGPLEAEIGPEASHGVWVEGGTSRMSPQPFLYPAADAVEPTFAAALQRLGDPFHA